MKKLNAIMIEKQKELVKLAHAKKDYGSLTDEINILREKKHEFLVRRAKTEGQKENHRACRFPSGCVAGTRRV